MTALGRNARVYTSDSNSTIDQRVAPIDIVAINGLYPGKDIQCPWELAGEVFWPKQWLLHDLPQSRLLVVGNGLSNQFSWTDLLEETDEMLRCVDRFRDDSRTPFVVFCHGLGGLFFLQCWKCMQSAHRQRVRKVFFLGTPIVASKPKDFEKAFRACVVKELKLEHLRKRPVDEKALQNLQELVPILQSADFQIVSFYETKESVLKTTMIGLDSKSKVIPKEVANCSADGAICIGLDSDHSSIARLARTTYTRHVLPQISSVIGALGTFPSEAPAMNATERPEQHWISPVTAIPMTSEVNQGHSPSEAVTTLSYRPLSSQSSLSSTASSVTSSRFLAETTTNAEDESMIVPQLSESRDGQISFHAFSAEPATDNDRSASVGTVPQTISVAAPSAGDLRNVLGPSADGEPSSRAVLPCRWLPTVEGNNNIEYVGRTSYLKAISSALLPTQVDEPKQTRTKAFAIIGTAGQGKTQTALQFAVRNQASYQAILWTRADKDHKVLQDFAEFAVAIGVLAKTTNNLWEDAKALIRWFEVVDLPWLLIFDNADDPKLVCSLWPRSRNGSILVTSRDPQFKTPNVAGHGKLLPSLEKDAAIELMRYGLPQLPWTESDCSEALKILEVIGFHPFTILVVISQMNEAGCSLEDYRGEYQLNKIIKDAPSVGGNNLFTSYELGMAELWSPTLAKLDPNTRALMELFAVLDVDNCQEDLLKLHVKQERIKTLGYVENRITCIKNLLNQGMMYANEAMQTPVSRTFHIHRLTQANTRMEMSDHARMEAFEVASYLVSATISPPWEVKWPQVQKEYKELYPHAQSILDYYVDSIKSRNKIEDLPLCFLELLWKGGWLCYRRGLLTAAMEFVRVGENILNYLNGGQGFQVDEAHLAYETIELKYVHACIATEFGDFETSYAEFSSALECYKDTVKRSINRSPRPRQCTLYGGIGNSLNGMGRQKEAEKAYRKCLKLNPPDVEFPVYEINICRCLWAQGKLNDASKRLKKFLVRRATKYGPEDTVDYLTGHAWYWFGNVRIGQNRLDEAFNMHLRAVKLWKVTYGDHHRTGDAYHKLGWHLARRRDYTAAVESLQIALRIYESGSDKDFRKGELARTTYKLGLVYHDQGKQDKADSCIEHAQQLRIEALGAKYVGSETTDEESFDSLVSLWAR